MDRVPPIRNRERESSWTLILHFSGASAVPTARDNKKPRDKFNDLWKGLILRRVVFFLDMLPNGVGIYSQYTLGKLCEQCQLDRLWLTHSAQNTSSTHGGQHVLTHSLVGESTLGRKAHKKFSFAVPRQKEGQKKCFHFPSLQWQQIKYSIFRAAISLSGEAVESCRVSPTFYNTLHRGGCWICFQPLALLFSHLWN